MQEKEQAPPSFVLWVEGVSHQTRLKNPTAVFTAASVEQLRAFGQAHRLELFGIPAFRFNCESGAPFATPPDESHANIPWRVELFHLGDGAAFRRLPDKTIPELSTLHTPAGMTEGDKTAARMRALTRAAAELCATIHGPVWEIFADLSGGLIVAGIARARRGWGVALAAGGAPSLAAMAIGDEGASLTSRESDIVDESFRESRPARLAIPRGLIH